MTGGVYALLDSENVVRYVGQSCNIEKRFSHHKATRGWPVKWLRLHTSDKVEERLKAEREWVGLFWGFLENKTKGGEFSRDSILPSTSKLISASSQAHWDNPEWRKAQTARIGAGIRAVPKIQRRAVALDRWKNPVTAQAIKAGLRKTMSDPAYRERKSRKAIEVFSRPQVIEKLRIAQQHRWTQAERERASRYMKLRMSDPLEKSKVSTRMKGKRHSLGYKHTPEAKARIGAAAKGNQWNVGKTLSPETRLKLSLAQKGKPKPRRIP